MLNGDAAFHVVIVAFDGAAHVSNAFAPATGVELPGGVLPGLVVEGTLSRGP